MDTHESQQSIDIITLTNGFKVGFLYIKEAKFATFHLRGLAGTNYESESQIGAAHAIEHCLMSSYVPICNLETATIVGVTDRDYVLYMIKALEHEYENTLELLSSILFSKTIDAANLEHNKRIINAEVQRIYDNPEKLLSRIGTYNVMFRNTRLAKINQGTPQDINLLTANILQTFLKTHYTANKFCLVVSGKFDKELIVSSIANKFDNKIQAIPQNSHLSLVTNQDFGLQVIQKQALQKSYLRIDFLGFSLGDSMEPLAHCLAIYLNQKLTNHIKHKLGLAYTLHTSHDAKHNFGLFEIFVETMQPNTQHVVYEILNQLNMPLDQNLITKAKTKMLTHLIFDFEKLSAKGDYYSRMLLENTCIPLEKYIDKVKNINLQDLQVCLEHITSQKPKITCIGNINPEIFKQFEEEKSLV